MACPGGCIGGGGQPYHHGNVDILKKALAALKESGIPDQDIQTVVGLLLVRGEGVTPAERVTACRDPKDDKFLEIAVAGEADVIVSGDQDLLVLHPFAGIPIVPPNAFLRMLDEEQR